MNNAPGQLLGYTMQLPRALYYLLISGPGDSVCVEVLGDVATFSSDGKIITEEDKSSISSNPLTNRSTDLWKTFSNWINAINNKEIDIYKTHFILYCNKTGNPGLVNEFDVAHTEIEIKEAIRKAKTELNDIDKDHDIWEYYNNAINKNENILLMIIERFALQIGIGAGYDEVRAEIQRKHVPSGQIEFILNNLSGWLQKTILEAIAVSNSPIITWIDFDHQFKVLFDRIRHRELIDSTTQYLKDDDKVLTQIKMHPIYLQQLEAINLSDEEIMAEISDYLLAEVNREQWIENEVIDETVAHDFEARLISFWKNQKKSIQIIYNKKEEIEQGQLLLSICKSRQETIRGENPPSSTIAGTYHALSDELELGWHPIWETIFHKYKEE